MAQLPVATFLYRTVGPAMRRDNWIVEDRTMEMIGRLDEGSACSLILPTHRSSSK